MIAKIGDIILKTAEFVNSFRKNVGCSIPKIEFNVTFEFISNFLQNVKAMMYENFNWSHGKVQTYHLTECWLENMNDEKRLLSSIVGKQDQHQLFRDLMLFGELVPPNAGQTPFHEAVCIPFESFFVDLGLSEVDKNRGLWFVCAGALFKIVSFIEAIDNEHSLQMLLKLQSCFNRPERAPLRQPIRQVTSVVLVDVHGSHCIDLRSLNGNYSVLTLTGQLVGLQENYSLPIRTYVNRCKFKLKSKQEGEESGLFVVQDFHGVWYELHSFAGNYNTTAQLCIAATERSLAAVFDWPSPDPKKVTRHVSHFILPDDEGNMVPLDHLAEYSSTHKVHLQGTLLPCDSPTASLSVCVSVNSMYIDWNSKCTISAFFVVSADGVRYQLSVPSHFAYTETMREFVQKSGEVQKFLCCVSKLCVHEPRSGAMICNQHLHLIHKRFRKEFDVEYIRQNTAFTVIQLQAGLGIGKGDELIKNLVTQPPVREVEKEKLDDVLSEIMSRVEQLDAITLIADQDETAVTLLLALQRSLKRIPFLFTVDVSMLGKRNRNEGPCCELQNVPRSTRLKISESLRNETANKGSSSCDAVANIKDVYRWSEILLEKVDSVLSKLKSSV